MREIWLHTNRRAILLGMLVPALLALGGAVLATAAWSFEAGWWWIVAGVACLVVSAIALAMLVRLLIIPRLAYETGELLVFVDHGEPIRVPIDVVEVFFLGQGPSSLPRLQGREPETANVIVRLAESAPQWRHLDVSPRFVHWCEGYITLHGAWCERIDPEALRKLNHRLAEIHRQRKAQRLDCAAEDHHQRGAARS